MKLTPEDCRNATWEAIQGELSGFRAEVHEALLRMGGAVTTRALSAFMEADILRVRPRVTELVDLGLVVAAGHVKGEHGKHEGLYLAVPLHQARAAHDARHAGAAAPVAVQRDYLSEARHG